MHIHILGICGTFMGGIALLARAAGHTVSGQDAGVYPPMSEQLAAAGIDLTEGYAPAGIPAHTDRVVIVWSVVVTVHILRHALGVNQGIALLFALGYTFLAYSVMGLVV